MAQRCVIIGFGSVARTTFPILRTIFPKMEYVLVDQRVLTSEDLYVTEGEVVTVLQRTFTYENVHDVIDEVIHDNDIIFDFTACTPTVEIIEEINKKKNVVYVDTAIEEWLEYPSPTAWELYRTIHAHDHDLTMTAIIDAGANPGLITHFCILGLRHMAESAINRKVKDSDVIARLLHENALPELATVLGVDVIHISEHETITLGHTRAIENAAPSSWAVDSFQEEWNIEGEVSIGTHDQEALSQPGYHTVKDSYPPIAVCPYPTFLRSAIGNEIFVGKIVRHPEVMEISAVFRDEKNDHSLTVGFVYHPSEFTLEGLRQENWNKLPGVVVTEVNSGPLDGVESMGATLISSREDIPPRWYGSCLSCAQSRDTGCLMNPTTLQVAASAAAHMKVAMTQRNQGLKMPHDFDSDEIMKVAAPYLGTIVDCDLDIRLPYKWADLLTTEQVQ